MTGWGVAVQYHQEGGLQAEVPEGDLLGGRVLRGPEADRSGREEAQLPEGDRVEQRRSS